MTDRHDGDVSAPMQARRGCGAIALSIGMTLFALALLLPVPVIVYDCESGETGARCTISDRYAGTWSRKQVTVTQIQKAEGETHEVSGASQPNGGSSARETHSSLTFSGAGDVVLYRFEQSGLVGSDAETIAREVGTLASGVREERVLRWQMPWVEVLFSSLLLLIAVPTLLDEVRRRFTPLRGSSTVYWLEFGAVAGPLAAGWWLALQGSF